MTDPSPELVEAIEAQARAIYEGPLRPLAERYEFEPIPSKSETSGLPTVLLLGNHSAGKSSFVNFLLGADLQRTGIAPVDDGFTVITHGETSVDKDGAALITNPDLAWGELERFGQTLVSHLRLRQLNNPALRGLALIDSPGMIDAADTSVDRGYDFPAVVRWFAEQADVILFLFDPDKPGTTGETLKILTDSLGGLDHKLLLIFNKVDRFSTMRDFARAYGALCWNLGKAIPRKDLPHVFTTYLPVPDARGAADGEQGWLPVEDFDKQREEVRAEVQRAPQRRLDNVVSRLYQYSRRLRMHALVLDQLALERSRHLRSYLFMGLAVLLLGSFAFYMEWSLISSEGWDRVKWTSLTFALTSAVLAGIYGFFRWDRRVRDENLSLDALFDRTYRRELTLGEKADDLRGLWASVRERVKRALAARGTFPRLKRGDLRRLDKVLDGEVPALRAEASK